MPEKPAQVNPPKEERAEPSVFRMKTAFFEEKQRPFGPGLRSRPSAEGGSFREAKQHCFYKMKKLYEGGLRPPFLMNLLKKILGLGEAQCSVC